MKHLMKLEIKKYKLTKYIKGIFIAAVCIIAFITISLVDSMTDPEQTKDTYDSVVRMLNLLVTGTFVVFSSVLTAKYIIGEYKDRTILLMFTYPVKREKIILTKLAMICSFTGISIAIGYALCLAYVTIAEVIFDVTASTITVELIIYGIKEMIISVILGSVLSLFPYIIGIAKKSVSLPIIVGVLAAFIQTPLMGRNPDLVDAIVKIAFLMVIALLGVKITFKNKINELDCNVN